MKHMQTQQSNEVNLSGAVNRYIYVDSGANGSGYVKDMNINADTGGLAILHGNSEEAKEFLKKAVELMNKYCL